jgi:nitrogen fixation protein NifU and related proteins
MATYSQEILRLAEITPVKIPEGVTYAEVVNRLCGDKIRVAIDIEEDSITRIRWHVEGCAILRASAAFMARSLVNNTVPETRRLIEEFNKSFTTENAFRQSALEAIYTLPARYKCALLPWQACENFLGEL